ncbi:MAG: ABC transporter substrate-binding protein [Burkholderiales bacterium]
MLGLLGLGAQAQAAPRKARVAFLGGGVGLADPGMQRTMANPFRQGLREAGYVEGQNLEIEWRLAEGKPERLPALLAELLAWGPDVLVTSGPRPALLAKEATRSLPIVAAAVDDPVAMGLAASHARPGGNITGVSLAFEGILPRRLQLLKDLVPEARRLGVLINPVSLSRVDLERDFGEVARKAGVQLLVFEARGPEDFDAAFAAIARERVDILAVLAEATFYVHRVRLIELSLKQRLPSAWGGRDYVEAGGLLSFQGDFATVYRRAAGQVDKILKRANPAEMPFEQSSKLELALNLRTARLLGLKVPQSVLVSADEVIE